MSEIMGKRNGEKVIVAGHICLDITPAFQNEETEHVTDLFRPGSLAEVGAASMHTGGCVANTGIAMKLLGEDVCLLGKIGEDAFGRAIKDRILEYGIADTLLLDPECGTSYSIVLAPRGIDRMFLHYPGANHTFSASDIRKEQLKDARLFHFGYPSVMRRMYQEAGKELAELFHKAKSCGAATSLDLSAVDEHSEAGAADWEKIVKRVLPDVDLFVPSVEELAFMIDRKQYDAWKREAAGRDITSVLHISQIQELAQRLLDWGADILLIKCGAAGMYLAVNDHLSERKIAGRDVSNWQGIRHFEAAYKPRQVLSATGAGDTSIAAFLCAFLQGASWLECVQLAAATGASCVESYDALSSLKSLKEQRERIRNGWEKTDLKLKP